MLKKAAVIVERDKPTTNLLQEVPEKFTCIRLSGTAEALEGESWTATVAGSVGELFSPDEVEQGLIVQGRKAKLYAYADPTEPSVNVLRTVVELPPVEKPAPKKLSRSKRRK